MADRERRLEIGEVGDRLQRRPQLLLGQLHRQRRLDGHQRLPTADRVELVEQLGGGVTEHLDQLRIELRPPTRLGDGQRRVDTADPMEHLDHVGQVHQPRGDEDLVAACAVRFPLAIPPFERLRHAVAHRLVDTQPLSQRIGGAPMVLEHRVHRPPALTEEAHTHTSPPRQRPPGADAPDDEHRALQRLAEIDAANVVLDRPVVTEPLRLLVGVDMAPDPRQQRRVQHHLPLRRRKPDPLTEAHGEHALAQHVLQRMPHPEVRAQRQRRQQLRQPHPRTHQHIIARRSPHQPKIASPNNTSTSRSVRRARGRTRRRTRAPTSGWHRA